MSLASSDQIARVLEETLRQSKLSNILDLEQIALGAKTSTPAVKTIMAQFLRLVDSGHFSIEPKSRVQLAMELARIGHLKEAAKNLSWQEFESFGAECLVEAGFRVSKSVRVKGEGRAWQIDLVGYRGDLVLTIDCKHWNTSGHESRLAPPAEHQRLSTVHLLRTLTERLNSSGKKLQGLPAVLTLLDPPVRFLEKTALVSVEQLPGFLNAVAPYDVTLPLISVSNLLVENPMS